jgi:hypothetical protein
VTQSENGCQPSDDQGHYGDGRDDHSTRPALRRARSEVATASATVAIVTPFRPNGTTILPTVPRADPTPSAGRAVRAAARQIGQSRCARSALCLTSGSADGVSPSSPHPAQLGGERGAHDDESRVLQGGNLRAHPDAEEHERDPDQQFSGRVPAEVDQSSLSSASAYGPPLLQRLRAEDEGDKRTRNSSRRMRPRPNCKPAPSLPPSPGPDRGIGEVPYAQWPASAGRLAVKVARCRAIASTRGAGSARVETPLVRLSGSHLPAWFFP